MRQRDPPSPAPSIHSATLPLLEQMEKGWPHTARDLGEQVDVITTFDITPKLPFVVWGCECCVCSLEHVFVRVEARGRLWVSFFSLFTFLFFVDRVSLNLKLISTARQVD